MTEQKIEPQTGSETSNPTGPAGEQTSKEAPKEIAKEIGGRKGPEPTRYGDWEKGGICSDF